MPQAHGQGCGGREWDSRGSKKATNSSHDERSPMHVLIQDRVGRSAHKSEQARDTQNEREKRPAFHSPGPLTICAEQNALLKPE